MLICSKGADRFLIHQYCMPAKVHHHTGIPNSKLFYFCNLWVAVLAMALYTIEFYSYDFVFLLSMDF